MSISPQEVSDALGFEQMSNMFAHGQLQVQHDLMGVWGFDRQSNAIVRMQNPGKTTIGDIRVKYFISSNALEAKQREFIMTKYDSSLGGHIPLRKTLVYNPGLTFEAFIE